APATGRGAQADGRPAGHRNGEEPEVPRERVDDRPAEKRDRVTGGREVRMDGGPRGPGQATGRPSVRGHHPDVADVIVVALVVAGAREGGPRPVRGRHPGPARTVAR